MVTVTMAFCLPKLWEHYSWTGAWPWEDPWKVEQDKHVLHRMFQITMVMANIRGGFTSYCTNPELNYTAAKNYTIPSHTIPWYHRGENPVIKAINLLEDVVTVFISQREGRSHILAS